MTDKKKSIKIRAKGHELHFNVPAEKSKADLEYLVRDIFMIPSAIIINVPYDESYPDDIHRIDNYLIEKLNRIQTANLFRERAFVEANLREFFRDDDAWERIKIEIEDSKPHDCAFFEKIGPIYQSRGDGGVWLKDVRYLHFPSTGEVLRFQIKVKMRVDYDAYNQDFKEVEIWVDVPIDLYLNPEDDQWDAWIESKKIEVKGGSVKSMTDDLEELRRKNPQLFDACLKQFVPAEV